MKYDENSISFSGSSIYGNTNQFLKLPGIKLPPSANISCEYNVKNSVILSLFLVLIQYTK